MAELTPDPDEKKASVLPYALFVPVLVVMAQSAWAIRGGHWSYRHVALLAYLFHPMVLGLMAMIALISFFVIREFAHRALSRLVAFLGCVFGFTVIVEELVSRFTE